MSHRSDESLHDSVQFALFNYCRFRRAMEGIVQMAKGNQIEAEIDFDEINEGELVRLYRKYYRMMNEIIVHTLDFTYFFESQPELYIDYLWQSWATVPSVHVDPEHYILRTLAATSTAMSGPFKTRFDDATTLFITRIEKAIECSPSTILFRRVRALLKDDKSRNGIKALALAHQYLAELRRRS